MLSRALQRVPVRPIQVPLAALLLAPQLVFSSLPKPASTAGMAVAGGTVTSATGTAMPGVTVDLYAWPSDAVLKALKPGQLVPTTLLTTATTSSTGDYVLKVPAAKLKAAAVESGYANLEIYSPLGGTWFLSYQTSSLPGRPSAPATVNLRAKKVGVDCGKYNDVALNFTGFAKQRNRPNTWAVVGQGYIIQRRKTKGDWVTLEYNKGRTAMQASSLGIALSGYGFEAGYNGDGSNVSTATASEGFSHSSRNAWFRTQFTTAQYRGMCFGPQGVKIPHKTQKGRCPRVIYNDLHMKFYVSKCYWMVHSTGWWGGTSTTHPKRIPRARKCAPHEANSDYDSDYGVAVQWSSGFDLGASLNLKGANLKASFSSSAQTGYDTNDHMYFWFHQQGHLCGTNASEAKAAILVQRP